MNKNTSVSLGSYFDRFIESRITEGRYKNVSEVVRAGLRLLEEEEMKLNALKEAIQEGLSSGFEPNFDPEKHLQSLKSNRHDKM